MTLAAPHPSTLPTETRAVIQPRRTMVPVKWWAALGVAVVAFEIFVLMRWITGPLFASVPVGADDPPTYMKVAIIALQCTSVPAALGCLCWFVVRPWRRVGHLTTDGALTIGFATLWFQDPLSAYWGPWFTYNSYAVNRGSWVNSVPGAIGPADPGAMVVEPVLIIPGVYVWVFIITMFLGAWVMRSARQRWPQIGNVGLFGICALTMFAFDVVFEGLVILPLGIWSYPGGHWNLFDGRYHQFPVNEMITVGTLFAAVACLRFFKNDRGETLVERGLEELTVSTARKNGLRAFAMIGVVHLLLVLCYNLPNSWIATHMREWPADVQNRTYLNDGICGEGTVRGDACPQWATTLPVAPSTR